MSTFSLLICNFLDEINQLDRTAKLPGDMLQRCLASENYLRHLFAKSPESPQLADPYAGLINVFVAFNSYKGTNPNFVNVLRARSVEDFVTPSFFLHQYRLFPTIAPRLKHALVPNYKIFKRNWDIFTHGILANLDWTNIIAAGGSVQACMVPLSDGGSIGEPLVSNPSIDEYFQNKYPTSNVDLFIWGDIVNKAPALVRQICSSVSRTVPGDVVYVRKANTISVHSMFPRRPVQIVLNFYRSPAEILAGFDVDSSCFAFDGTTVWTNPRGFAASIRRCNVVATERRSPSYEERLSKYALRGFEVFWPSLQRQRINEPLVYNRDLKEFPNGLALLLVLEKRAENPEFYRSLPPNSSFLGEPKSDLSTHNLAEHKLKYDSVWTGLPYGKAWNAATITHLIQWIDIKLNGRSPETDRLAEDGRHLHRHAAVASKNVSELLLGSFCKDCPNAAFLDIREEIDARKYVFGPVQFLPVNAGRFNPLTVDDHEWTNDAYLAENVMGNAWSLLATRVYELTPPI